jgi:hypothetical protein
MKKLILGLIFSSIILSGFAQGGMIKVSNGKVIEGDFFLRNQYMLTSFLDSKITLLDGTVYDGVININTVSQTLRTLGRSGDTLGVNVESKVKAVSTGTGFFFKINGMYLKVLETNGEVFLVQSKVLKIWSEDIRGPYGGSGEVASITKVDILDNNSKVEKVIGESTFRFDLFKDLYLVKSGRLYPINKKTLSKLFSGQKKSLQADIQKFNTDFSNKDDLENLVRYLINNK